MKKAKNSTLGDWYEEIFMQLLKIIEQYVVWLIMFVCIGMAKKFFRVWTFWPIQHIHNPGIKPASPLSLALADGFFTDSCHLESPNIEHR